MKVDGRRTFEALLRAQVYLLRLRDLFEEVLDDHSVVVAYLAAPSRQGVVGGQEGISYLGVISIWKLL